MGSNYVARLIQIRPQYSMDPDADNTPENVLWMQSGSSGTPTSGDLATIQSIFDDGWSALWKAQAGADSSYLGSVITDWSSDTGISLSSVGTFGPVAGTGGATSTAPQVAILISYAIPIRYRGGHPRTYLPHLASGKITGTYKDSIASGDVTNINTAYNALFTALNGSGILGGQSMAVFRGKTTPATPSVYIVGVFTAQTLLATQRRRIRHVSRK